MSTSKSKTRTSRSPLRPADERPGHRDGARLGLGPEHQQVHVVGRLARPRLGHGEAAFARDDRRVHERDRLVDDAGQQPLQGRRASATRVSCSASAAQYPASKRPDGAPARPVSSAPSFSASGRNGRTSSPTSAPADDVHRVGHELAPQRQAHHLGDGRPRLVLRLLGRGPEMRGHDGAVVRNSGLRRRRLLGEHVHGGAAQPAAARGPRPARPRPRSRRAPCSPAARPAAAGPAPARPISPSVSGVRGRWIVRKSACTSSAVQRRHQLDAELPAALLRHVRVEGHARACRTPRRARRPWRRRGPGRHAQGLAVQLDALEPLPLPPAGPERRVAPAGCCAPAPAAAPSCARRR